MEIEINLNKSVDENAGDYFELAKKAKKKLEGAKKALEESKKKLAKLWKEESKFLEEERVRREEKLKKDRKREWYEKFHWFFSSDDFLCIGGKDATTNEIVIKKHLDKEDLVLHTDAPGSPFFVVKNGQNASENTISEAAQATAVYSKAWKLGHSVAEVFSVLPEQVSKEAKSGEYISKGSFMIYGKKNFFHPKLEYVIGIVDGIVISGPVSVVSKKTGQYVVVLPGEEKKSSLAKKIRAKLKEGDLDDIIRFLPGEAEMRK